MEINSFEIRGVRVAAIDVYRARDLIGTRARSARGEYVTVTGAHGVVESTYDAGIRDAHQHADIVVADGMPLVWLGRLLGFGAIGRVNGPELMELIFADATLRDLRHFFYGANPTAIMALRDTLVARFGAFNMVGMHCPPMRPLGFNEDEEVITRIQQLKPHIIWVGLSTPKQEVWMRMHMPKIGCGVAVGVGAAFDLLSGTTLRAPRWIQRSGFEWLFRLIVEPRRLYRRYVFVIPRFAYFWLEALVRPPSQPHNSHRGIDRGRDTWRNQRSCSEPAGSSAAISRTG
jgi:N-acetylglucosaminyldiphosphoundecaprenol N-acetyl-beta-D-mannosaminyltransferase